MVFFQILPKKAILQKFSKKRNFAKNALQA